MHSPKTSPDLVPVYNLATQSYPPNGYALTSPVCLRLVGLHQYRAVSRGVATVLPFDNKYTVTITVHVCR